MLEESQQAFFIFVEGADTLPPKLPVYLVYGREEKGISPILRSTMVSRRAGQ